MFSVGEEIVCIDDSPGGDGQPFGVKKGEVFIVLGVLPVGTILSVFWQVAEPSIQIGKANPTWERFCDTTWWPRPDNFDCWAAERFRKVEKKREREELYALIGIGQMLTTKTPELTDAR